LPLHSSISRRQFARFATTAAAGLTGPALGAQSPAGRTLRSEFLMDLVFKTGGGGAIGPRLIAGITEGTFQGPKLKGKVATPAGESGATRPDGAYVNR
jgi:hypothetical protein